ncbi:MAG: TetR/AcrR family transcriptional regulator [Solirubrobacteraceae bacterium]|nr:TetR/AcrR family transcriptional regulator [Solirubrobacteraceae bacterium]
MASTPPDTSTRTRAPHLGPERRRPLVLDAALQVYLRTGFDGASMDAIAAEAGVTKPVLYDCYPNKRELFAALLRREAERLLQATAASLPSTIDFEHPAETLRGGFTGFFRAVASAPDSFRATVMAVHDGLDPQVAAGVEQHRAEQVGRITAMIAAWLETADVEDPAFKAEISANAVAGVGDAFARLIVVDPERYPPDDMADKAATILLRGFEGLSGLTIP